MILKNFSDFNRRVRATLRNVHYSSRARAFNALYAIEDPWGMESEKERFRFERTNALIKENIGHVRTLLEIGCGEGHQSSYLMHVCDQLYGVDISKRAVKRAAKRCPQGGFEVGSLLNARCFSEVRHFDLVVACEVLYYIKDVTSTLRGLSECSDWCLITYYCRQADRLDPHVMAISNVRSATIQYNKVAWTVAWWKNSKQG